MATVTSSRLLALYGQSPRVYPPAPIVLTADTPVTGIGTLGSINTTAQSAATTANAASGTANAALGGLANKLSNGAANVMSGGFSLKTPGYDGGTGGLLSDYGLLWRSGGNPVFVLDATTGGAIFSGTLDCGNGAVIRTPNLAVSGYSDLINLKISNGNQFGSLRSYADLFGYGSNNHGCGWEYNFSGLGYSYLGIADTSSGASARLVLSSNGAAMISTYQNGALQDNFGIPKNNGIMQGDLNAEMVGGYRASSFAIANGYQVPNLNAELLNGFSSGHSFGQIPRSDGILNSGLNAERLGGIYASSFSQVGHSHSYWVPQTYTIDLYNESGTTYIGSYQVRIKNTSYWWTYSTST